MSVGSYTVYIHTAPNGKKYVGITCRPIKIRYGKDGVNYKSCSLFWKAINKYGWEAIEHQVITDGLTASEAKQMEIELIRALNTYNPLFGYNLTIGGDGTTGYRRSAETRAKDSARRIGNKYHLGHRATDESKAKMSAARKGKIYPSEETRARLSAKSKGNQHALGYKHTDKAKKKISERHKGNKNMLGRYPSIATKLKMSVSHFKPVIQYTIDGEEVARFPSVKAAALSVHADVGNIAGCCRGRQQTSHSFVWKYMDNN